MRIQYPYGYELWLFTPPHFTSSGGKLARARKEETPRPGFASRRLRMSTLRLRAAATSVVEQLGHEHVLITVGGMCS